MTSTSSAKPERRAGVPVWRVGKPDAMLARAVDFARAALLEAVEPAHVGAHLAAKSEGERLVTHLFACLRPGYRGWTWYVTLARVSRSKVPTVSELGLLPSEDSVLAPEWVPWSDRVRPDEREEAIEAAGAESGEEGDVEEAAVAEAIAEAVGKTAEDVEEEVEAGLGADDEVDAEAEEAGVTDIDDEID